MHTAYLDTTAGYPQIATHLEPDCEADRAFYIHNITKDIERLTRSELEMVVAELKPETIKRLYASIVDHRA